MPVGVSQCAIILHSVKIYVFWVQYVILVGIGIAEKPVVLRLIASNPNLSGWQSNLVLEFREEKIERRDVYEGNTTW